MGGVAHPWGVAPARWVTPQEHDGPRPTWIHHLWKALHVSLGACRSLEIRAVWLIEIIISAVIPRAREGNSHPKGLLIIKLFQKPSSPETPRPRAVFTGPVPRAACPDTHQCREQSDRGDTREWPPVSNTDTAPPQQTAKITLGASNTRPPHLPPSWPGFDPCRRWGLGPRALPGRIFTNPKTQQRGPGPRRCSCCLWNGATFPARTAGPLRREAPWAGPQGTRRQLWAGLRPLL